MCKSARIVVPKGVLGWYLMVVVDAHFSNEKSSIFFFSLSCFDPDYSFSVIKYFF